jgi:hypothetical protein
MITVSDNTATDMDAGFHDPARGKGLPEPGGLLQDHARDLGVLMAQIARSRAVSRRASATMLDILRLEQHDTIIGRFLPKDGHALAGHRTICKVASRSGSTAATGSPFSLRNEAGSCHGIPARLPWRPLEPQDGNCSWQATRRLATARPAPIDPARIRTCRRIP